MFKKALSVGLLFIMLCSLAACGAFGQQDTGTLVESENMTLIERNSFARGITLPERLSSTEETTREYEIGDFGYWNAGPDLAIFYDDIYEQTIV